MHPYPEGFYTIDGSYGEWGYEEHDMSGELRPVRFDYAVQEDTFFRLRFTFNEARNLFDYTGIVLVLEAVAPTGIRVELSTGGWNLAFTPIYAVQDEVVALRIPFAKFILEDQEGQKLPPDVLLAIDAVDGISVWPEAGSGSLLILAMGVYR
jgi:hypothetical protein